MTTNGNPQTYASLQIACLQATVKSQPPYTTIPPDFAVAFVQAIAYAEGRIYKDIVTLATRTQDTSLTNAANSRIINLAPAANTIVVTERIALIVPTGVSNPAIGSRVWYDPASLDLIDQLWPQESATIEPSLTSWAPRYFAMRDATTIVFCPTAANVYTVELTGLFQPVALSASNPSTYLSSIYPELLFTALMVFLTGPLLHNWSAQSSDPKMAVSFEGQYDTLRDLAKDEEARRRGLKPDEKMPQPMGRPA